MRKYIEVLIIPTIIIVIVLSSLILWNTTAYRDVDNLKENAPLHLTGLGFNIKGYNGYTGGLFYGGNVFYLVNYLETPNIYYEVQVVEWRGEIQSYVPKIINPVIIN